MSTFFASSSHMPCPDCGASVEISARETHVCDPQRLLDYRMFQLRDEIEGLEDGLRDYFESPHGRFARWLAERERTTP